MALSTSALSRPVSAATSPAFLAVARAAIIFSSISWVVYANIAKGESKGKLACALPNRILYYLNIAKGESKGKLACTLPRRILYYVNIVKAEGKGKLACALPGGRLSCSKRAPRLTPAKKGIEITPGESSFAPFLRMYRGTEAFAKMEKKKKKKKKEHTRPQIFMLSDEMLRRVA